MPDAGLATTMLLYIPKVQEWLRHLLSLLILLRYKLQTLHRTEIIHLKQPLQMLFNKTILLLYYVSFLVDLSRKLHIVFHPKRTQPLCTLLSICQFLIILLF